MSINSTLSPPDAGPFRLSVIVPTYNRGSFLPGCIESLRKAGVPDLEIIIVDDGSTDDTRAVVASLGSDLRYIYQDNQGLSAARNTGIRASRGRFIAYLDSDDFWLPGVADNLIGFLEHHPQLGAVFADARMGNPESGYVSWFDAAGREEFRSLPAEHVELGLRMLEPLPFYRLMLSRNAIFTGAVILRREVVSQHGLFNPALLSTGDWEVWLRLIHQTRFAYSMEPLAIYTKHAGAMTADREFMQQGWCDTLLTHAKLGLALAPEDRSRLDQALRNHLFSHAYLAYDGHDYSLARRRFAKVIYESGFEWPSALYWLICALPKPIPRMVRRLKNLIAV